MCHVKVVDDWGYVAVVIDRVQLYVFLVVTVVGSAVLLTNAPYDTGRVNTSPSCAPPGDSTEGNGDV